MRRVVVLAAVLIGLGVVVAAVAGWVVPDRRAVLRWLVLLGLPLLVGVLGVLFVPLPSVLPAGDRRAALLAALLVGVDLSPIGAGFLLHQVTFTYGDQTLAAGRIAAIALGLPLVVALTIAGWERGLRERLFGGALAAGAPQWGALLSVGAGVALSTVAIVPGFEVMDRGYVLAAWGSAALREATAVRVWSVSGRTVSGLYRGLLAGFEGLVLADWASFWFPSANFVSSDPRFVWVRIAGPAAALAVALAWARRAPAEAR